MYIFFIIAFGLGFYVSLNKNVILEAKNTTLTTKTVASNMKTEGKTENNKIKLDGEDYKFFNTSLQALVKASTMFSGELVR